MSVQQWKEVAIIDPHPTPLEWFQLFGTRLSRFSNFFHSNTKWTSVFNYSAEFCEWAKFHKNLIWDPELANFLQRNLYVFQGIGGEYQRFVNLGACLKAKSASLKVHFTDRRGNKEINRGTDLGISAFRCHYHVPFSKPDRL